MSVLIYNGVTLPLAFCTRFEQTALGDEMSDTDWYMNQYDIQVQSIINVDYLSVMLPAATLASVNLAGGVTNAADLTRVVYPLLMARRKSLQYLFNGINLIPVVDQNAGTADSQNGPVPKRCSIQELTNSQFLLTYHITANYWVNSVINGLGVAGQHVSENVPSNAVLYNRWSEDITLDECQYSTRTRSGKFAIRSDNAEGFIADELRTQMAVVGIPTGFLRRNANFAIHPDGLSVSYRITDEQVHKTPPSPAFAASGSYTEEGTRGGGRRFGNVNIRLRAPANVSQATLVETAVTVCAQKLNMNGALLQNNNKGFALLESVSVSTDMYDNSVSVSMRAMMQTGKARLRGIAGIAGQKGFTGNITVTPFSPVNGDPPAYTVRGPAGLILQAAAYYDSSIGGTLTDPGVGPDAVETDVAVDNNVQMNQGLLPGEAGKFEE